MFARRLPREDNLKTTHEYNNSTETMSKENDIYHISIVAGFHHYFNRYFIDRKNLAYNPNLFCTKIKLVRFVEAVKPSNS